MSTTLIDAGTLKKMFLAGAKNLEKNKEWINDLNVFPVPDGDTGTNMTLTVLSAVKEVQGVEEVSLETLSKAISSGSLRGARGNSGVIMSQLFRGFTKEMKEHETLDIPALSAAMNRATETAYKAVMKPKEGTILTVARGMSEKATELASENIELENFFDEIIKCGDETLAHTPELLPVLKQAGVVDSGGQGLMQFLKGAFAGFTGKADDADFSEYKPVGAPKVKNISSSEDLGDIKYGYCTEFLIYVEKHFDEEEEIKFKSYLESMGDCVVVVSDDEIVKVHVHTNDPGLAIQKGLSYGSLSKMKIDNMREEHEEKLIREASKIASESESPAPVKEHSKYGFVSIAAGDGIAKLFTELGVNEVIEGGQTMNPSTEDILEAIEKIDADNIYVFPNNKNIILAAEQTVELVEGKKIFVVPTATVPQGIAAIISFEEDMEPEEIFENMKETASLVKTGQITYAVRDTNIDGVEIHENDIMAIGDNGIITVGKDINRVAREMTSKLVDEDSVLISIYYGEDITDEEAENLKEEIENAHDEIDVEMVRGNQPVYYYIISVE